MVHLLIFWYILRLFPGNPESGANPKEKLSDYNFFVGPLADLSPGNGVIPYAINTPLFSNYAEKARFIKLPDGGTMSYRDSSVFVFSTGTVLIKNFYYPADFRKPEKGRVILETRLLVNESTGWQAYPYIWNAEQTEAYYDPAGETVQVKYISATGKKISTPYLIPNKNQCKGCHLSGDKLVPIGPSARQLSVGEEGINQLVRWAKQGLLVDAPTFQSLPAGIVWDDPATGNVNLRARAYLDANCAHCHSRQGSANTSGLYLGAYETNLTHLGVNKTPVAAGRGAGDLNFDIVPGEPGKSILVYRMKTNNPAIAMPEIGREQIHKEGLALIEEWIRTSTFTEK